MMNVRRNVGVWSVLATCAAGCSQAPASRGPSAPVEPVIWVFADSARAVIPTPRSGAVWTWNEPASRRLSPARGDDYLVSRTLQYGWGVRLDAPSRFELTAYQFSDYYGATRVDSLSRLLREADTCVCVRPGGEDEGTSEAAHFFPDLVDSRIFPLVEGGSVVLVLWGRRAVARAFEGRPDSATVYRFLPWPRVDSLRVPVRYREDVQE